MSARKVALARTPIAEPVSALELETLAINVHQAASTVSVIAAGLEGEAEAQEALELVSEYLHGLYDKVSELEKRHAFAQAEGPS